VEGLIDVHAATALQLRRVDRFDQTVRWFHERT
jgi:hypothetical protein